VIGSTRSGNYIAIAAGCASAFAILLVLVATGRPAFDLGNARWMAAHRSVVGIQIADAFSVVGSIDTTALIGLVALAWFRRRHGWRYGSWLVIASAGATLLYFIANLLMESTRPPIPLRVVDPGGWSFPSGHSTLAAAFWPMLAVLSRARWALVPAIAMVALIGGSRLYLDVHWTTDVAGGFALGTACLFGVLALRNRRASVPPP
jgi:undecaprenyl-diphosphatase